MDELTTGLKPPLTKLIPTIISPIAYQCLRTWCYHCRHTNFGLVELNHTVTERLHSESSQLRQVNQDTVRTMTLKYAVGLHPVIQKCTMSHWQVIPWYQWYYLSRLGPLRHFICPCHLDPRLVVSYHYANLFSHAHCCSKMTLVVCPNIFCDHRVHVCWRCFHFINAPTACSSGHARVLS